MKTWEAKIPKISKIKDRKKCYRLWTLISKNRWRAGGRVVWLTDKELMFAIIKYPKTQFEEVLEKDLLEEYKKYIDATIN